MILHRHILVTNNIKVGYIWASIYIWASMGCSPGAPILEGSLSSKQIISYNDGGGGGGGGE